MAKRVAVCAVAQIKNQPDIWQQRFQGMLLDCFESIVEQTGVTFDLDRGIRNVVSCSDDVFDARTISNNGMTDVLGAHFRGEEKVAQDGLNALGYAMSTILSGHDDVVLVMGHCKESQSESRDMCTNLAFDPFYCRPLGLDFVNAAAFQARAYGAKSGIREEHLAEIVVRARENGQRNPHGRENRAVSVDEVMTSPMLADPLRALHCYPVTDWACGVLLCCEERVAEFTDNPVWLTGFGNDMERYFLGDRDLASTAGLTRAAKRACQMAGVVDPRKEIDIFELNDAAAYQLPMWAEGVGLTDVGTGGKWIDGGGPAASHVNLSGGMLNGNPLMLGGMARAAYGIRQLRGEAGVQQVEGAKRALAHGTTGPAGQHHAVLIMENVEAGDGA